MQKFFTDTLESRYIKALLYEAYIPKYPSVSSGDIIVAGNKYIYGSNIILCTATGELADNAVYKVVHKYDGSVINRKLNDNFLSKERYYDSSTHERLGKFLRYYRDFTGIDLMPLYNCFSNRYNDRLQIKSSGITFRTDANIKVLEVPIKFNKTYTIAIDCNSPVYLAPAFIEKHDYVYSGDIDLTSLLYVMPSEEYESEVKQYASLAFDNPITYKLENTNSFLHKYEDKLVLLIQLPNYCNSSITVIEGDYTILCKKTINLEKPIEEGEDEVEMYFPSTKTQNEIFVSNLSLLRLDDRNTYAFSNKLIAYLLTHSITSREAIYNNVRRVQEDIDIEDYETVTPDVWDDMLRKVLFDEYMKTDKKGLDILGYVDNDIENFLLKKRANK